MLRCLKRFASTMLLGTTAFLVGCSGCVSKAGDKVTGTGTGTVSSTGAVTGSGTGTVTSQTTGTNSGTKNNSTVNIKMNNPTDKIVCTNAATGIVTVFSPGQTITTSGTSTCVDTPANQVPANAVPAVTTTGTTTTTTTTTAGSGTSGSGTSGSGNTGSGSNTTTAAQQPKNSF